MRIAIQNPEFLFLDQKTNFHGYNFAFFRRHVTHIYVESIRQSLSILKRMMILGCWPKRFVFSVRALNRACDVLICLEGFPHKPRCRPVTDFKGLKIYHTMDFFNRPSLSNELYREAGVNYLIAHNSADVYSKLFTHFYKDFHGKVISLPFGYGKRFVNRKPFLDRVPKALAVGSIYPVRGNPHVLDREATVEAEEFWKDEKWNNPIRRAIVENRSSWGDVIDDMLPNFPECRNADYDPVESLNSYMMFINSESLDNFPPARTFEGIACGSVMVSRRNAIYCELGFRDGFNCIMFDENDVDDMPRRIRYYVAHQNELVEIQRRSLELASKYTHEKVAEMLWLSIKQRREAGLSSTANKSLRYGNNV